MSFPHGTVVKNPPAKARDRRHRFNLWVGMIPWSRKWQPTPVFLPGKFHRQRSLADYSPKDSKESDTTELSMHSLESNSRNNKYNNFGHNQEEEKIMSLTRRETDFALTVKLNWHNSREKEGVSLDWTGWVYSHTLIHSHTREQDCHEIRFDNILLSNLNARCPWL